MELDQAEHQAAVAGWNCFLREDFEQKTLHFGESAMEKNQHVFLAGNQLPLFAGMRLYDLVGGKTVVYAGSEAANLAVPAEAYSGIPCTASVDEEIGNPVVVPIVHPGTFVESDCLAEVELAVLKLETFDAAGLVDESFAASYVVVLAAPTVAWWC